MKTTGTIRNTEVFPSLQIECLNLQILQPNGGVNNLTKTRLQT